MNFDLLTRQDDISVGKLDGETRSGVYLSAEFLDRLTEVYGPAQLRLVALLDNVEMPDAVRDLLRITMQVLSTYAAAVQPERDALLAEAMASAPPASHQPMFA
jgi:hypothetical protein